MNICRYESITTKAVPGHELTNFSLSINNGESLAVLGNNGSGKSLLGRLLTGKMKTFSGEAVHAEKASLVSFERINDIIEEDRIEADITEATFLNPGLTCEDLIIQESGISEIPADILEQFHLVERKDIAIRHLSTGEIGKSLLVGALLAKPDLLILDEPFDGLDVESREVLTHTIETIISGGTTLIIILNRHEEIPISISRIAFMESCKIVLDGDAATMLNSPDMKRLISMETNLPDHLPGESRIHPPKVDALGRLVAFKDVTIEYNDKTIINSVDWDLYPGDHWQISGPNGCGKSTLLALISGDNSQAYSNDITLFGFKRGSGETVWDIKKEVGVVSTVLQRDYRVPGSVLSAVMSGFHDSIGLYGKESPQERTEAMLWLQLMGMRELAKTPFRRLSYGEQRMILIARAMVKRPAVLILDEPCLGLDPINRQLVLKLVDFIGRTSQTTILYVTHHSEDAIDSIKHSMKFVPAESGGFTLDCSVGNHVVNDKICPLCGKPNGCMAGKKGPCWCGSVTIPQELKESIPRDKRGKACICRNCIEEYNAKQK